MSEAVAKTRSTLGPLVVIVGHALAATGWMVFMAGGFPLSHPRFWANRGVPMLLLGIAIAALVATIRGNDPLLRRIALVIPFGWFGAALGGVITFPASGRVPSIVAVVVGVILLRLTRPWPKRSALVVGIAMVSTLIGASIPPTQRAGESRTLPAQVSIDPPPSNLDAVASSISPRKYVSLQPATGELAFGFGRIAMQAQPMLTFVSRSPDRCWTNLAPRDARLGPPRELIGLQQRAVKLQAWYQQDDLTSLAIDTSQPGVTEIESRTRLPAPVYSHLNTFAQFELAGHRSLKIMFSPCESQKIDFAHAGYPIGPPARFAYFDGRETFYVVQATNAEKGPFHELARGPLRRGEALSMTLFDGDAPICRITLHDWAAQCSDEPSPTAAWGVPVNSIEFGLFMDHPSSPAGIWVSLAATSVGRGWDSVGHAAGVYRNRISIERLDEEASR